MYSGLDVAVGYNFRNNSLSSFRSFNSFLLSFSILNFISFKEAFKISSKSEVFAEILGVVTGRPPDGKSSISALKLDIVFLAVVIISFLMLVGIFYKEGEFDFANW